MLEVTLVHPTLGNRKLKVEDCSTHSDLAKWIVLRPLKASTELFEAPEYYYPKPNITTCAPNWVLTLNESVKMTLTKQGQF